MTTTYSAAKGKARNASLGRSTAELHGALSDLLRDADDAVLTTESVNRARILLGSTENRKPVKREIRKRRREHWRKRS